MKVNVELAEISGAIGFLVLSFSLELVLTLGSGVPEVSQPWLAAIGAGVQGCFLPIPVPICGPGFSLSSASHPRSRGEGRGLLAEQFAPAAQVQGGGGLEIGC